VLALPQRRHLGRPRVGVHDRCRRHQARNSGAPRDCIDENGSGVCQCSLGFAGVDCSRNLDDRPIIIAASQGSAKANNAEEVTVFGAGFYNDSPKCMWGDIEPPPSSLTSISPAPPP
jgi:hypothetical protein